MVACTMTESGDGHYRDQNLLCRLLLSGPLTSFICEAESFATAVDPCQKLLFALQHVFASAKGTLSMTPIIRDQEQQPKKQKNIAEGEEPEVKAPAGCDCRRMLNGTWKESTGLEGPPSIQVEICTPPDTRK